ncbi:CDP-glycerol glycerophosphotransferase family protein [Acinetobacter towneri]|uniref:CDP-glycerol glycerophosphotransferase family protein n=1 Tax=Acinetobacter towneri TaxID=202956 RepID=UPI00336BB5F1
MKYLKNIFLIGLMIFSILNRFFPKFNIIILFSNNKESNDNNRALLRKLIDLGVEKKYKIYFFSKDADKYNHFEKVMYKSAYLAPIYFLVAKYCFYDCGTLKIKPSSKQFVISLWHGIPLKQIGLLVGEQSSTLDRYNDFSKIIVTSPFLNDIYKRSFGCSDSQILINGFPRNDFLFNPNYKKLKKLGINLDFNKTFLWMPTFRKSIGGRYNDVANGSDWDLPIFKSFSDLCDFNKELDNINVQLIIKLHPYSILNLKIPHNLSNITFIRNSDLNKLGIINYEFVSCFDGLITDYSSILFDYLLIDKPMAFTVDDIQEYSKGRGFNFSNPEKYLVGEKINNKVEFLRFVNQICAGLDSYSIERSKIREEIHQFIDDKSTERLLCEIGLL